MVDVYNIFLRTAYKMIEQIYKKCKYVKIDIPTENPLMAHYKLKFMFVICYLFIYNILIFIYKLLLYITWRIFSNDIFYYIYIIYNIFFDIFKLKNLY